MMKLPICKRSVMILIITSSVWAEYPTVGLELTLP